MTTSKTKLLTTAAALLVTAITSAASAQYYDDSQYNYTPSYAPAPPVSPYQTPQTPVYTWDQLDQMVAPIALYPDPLLSQVLAAATYPQDVASLGQYLEYNPNPADADIDVQPWDPSVKAMAHYPQVVQMMANNMDWTEALGGAFANQQQDVMDAVQRMRAKALAAQTLATTPQQQIVNDNGVIEILPAQPEVIYVPQYDPEVVYVQPTYYSAPVITFGPAYPVGVWLDFGFDWHHHNFDRGVHWGRDWHHPDFGHVEHWEHDRRRPIPVPRHEFVAPRGADFHRDSGHDNRGWNDHRSSAFDPRSAPRTPEHRDDGRHVDERPVRGIPERPAPRPEEQTAPRPAEHVAPRQDIHPQAPQTPRIEPHPVATPRANPSPRPAERPVTGIGGRGPSLGASASPPVEHTAPRAEPSRSAPPAAPSPAFQPGSGGDSASGRGHSSMRR